jgi:energy-coupling factor transport system substrate-specific component
VPSITQLARIKSRKGAKVHATSRQTNSLVTTHSARWRVVDIVVASVVGVATGIIFWAWGQLYNPLSLIQSVLPGLQGLVGGVWLLGGVLGGLIVRKPGAALYTELLAAIVSALIGTQWGILTLLSGLVQGLGAEVVFALVLYRTWRVWVAILAGAGAGAAAVVTDLIVSYAGADVPFVIVYAVSLVVSGALLAGLLGWFIVRGLARSGALNRFAVGREIHAEV